MGVKLHWNGWSCTHIFAKGGISELECLAYLLKVQGCIYTKAQVRGTHWNHPWHSGSPDWPQVEYFKSLNFMPLHFIELITSSTYKCISVAQYPKPNQPTSPSKQTRELCILRWKRAGKLFPGMTRRQKWITEYFHQEVVGSLKKANNSMTKWEVCYFSLLYIIWEVWYLFIYFLSNSRGEKITNRREKCLSVRLCKVKDMISDKGS